MHDSVRSGKKFSIIIPALNEEKLLKRLLSQFTDELKKEYDLEVIVSDGGSRDLTKEIAKENADRLILHTEKYSQNISQGRNEGAKNSLGDVLIFLNADTCVNNIVYFLKEVIRQFEKKNVIAIACRIEVFPEEVRFSDKLFHGFYNNYVAFLNKFLMGMGRGECQIVRREKFFEVAGYNEKLAAGEDFDLFKRLRKLGKVKFRRDFLVYESPRRYRKFGYTRVFRDWTKNSLSVMLFHRSVSKNWEAVRWDFGFVISDLGFWIWNFGFGIWNFGFGILDLTFLILDLFY
ncbi:MAG: glycosyltransferase [Ignavibacteria bacterium]